VEEKGNWGEQNWRAGTRESIPGVLVPDRRGREKTKILTSIVGLARSQARLESELGEGNKGGRNKPWEERGW